MKKAVKKKKKVVRPFMLHKEDRGISKVVILAVVAIILAVGGGYYILGAKTGLSSVIPMGKAPLNPNCELKDSELCKFMNNWVTQKNYAVTTTSKMGGMSVDSLYEIDGDNFHSLSKQDGKENSNMISMGDTTYTLDYTDNKWWKMTTKPVEASKQEKEIKDQFKMDETTSTKDTTVYKFILKESCGDLTCFKYEIVMPDSGSSTQYMWFDDRDYLMRKLQVTDKENGSMESVYTYGSVHISVPSPVKEGNPYDSENTPDANSPEVKKMMQQYQQQSPADTNTEQPVQDTSSNDYQ